MKKFVSGIFCIVMVSLFIYNIITNCDFLKIPIYNLINIIVAVVIAYYFSQKRTDERKYK